MLDIGLGEVIVIAILALLVFGPDRLPKVASDAARTLRQVRQMAMAARKDLADAAGLDQDDELGQAVRDIQELDPRRALRGLGDEAGSPGPPGAAAGRSSAGRAAGGSAPGQVAAGAAAGGPAPASPGGDAGALAASGGGSQQSGPGQPAAGPVLEASPVDPDWT